MATSLRIDRRHPIKSKGGSTILDPRSDQEPLEANISPIREDDITRMGIQFQQLLAHSTDSMKAHGEQVFKRIASQNWSVEWNLSHWLTPVCALTEFQLQHLVAANVYGLGYVRLLDDRRDDEGVREDEESIRELEAILFQAAQSEFHLLLGDKDAFWDFFQATLSRWHLAEDHLLLISDVLELSLAQLSTLADVGAPLLIACAAGYFLNPATHPLEFLSAPVRHYLIAAVLYDHLKDWQEDLASARPNLFITTMLGTPSEPLVPEAVRLKLYAEMMRGGKVGAYSRLIQDQLARGAQSALNVGLDAFASHLRALEFELHESAGLMLRGMERRLKEGAEILISKKMSESENR